MMLRRASRLVLEAAALAAGLVASVGLTDALRGLPGPSLALALPLRETGHDDRASLLVVVGCSALLFGLAARALGGERPQPARGALVRAAIVLAGALDSASGLARARPPGDAGLRLGSRPALAGTVRERGRRAARNRGGRLGSRHPIGGYGPARRSVRSRADRVLSRL